MTVTFRSESITGTPTCSIEGEMRFKNVKNERNEKGTKNDTRKEGKWNTNKKLCNTSQHIFTKWG
jgi:hypothetical protein